MKKLNLKIFLFLLILLQLLGCSKDFSTGDIFINQPNNIVKIDGKYVTYISSKKMKLEKNFSSEDCDSWAVKINLDKAYKESISKILNSMFKDIVFTKKILSSEEIDKFGYTAQIIILHENAKSIFITEKNTGIFKVFLQSNIKVHGNNQKKITNNVSSNREWKKNVYVKCKLQEGALKATKESLEELIELVHSNVYESIYKITRN